MQGCKTITTMTPPATVAMIVSASNPDPSAVPERLSAVPEDDRPHPQAVQDDSAKFREDMRRRCETVFEAFWHHGGLNE